MMETGQRYAQNEQESDLEEYQQQSSFKKIEELENHGVNKTDIIKLKAGGYHTIEAVSKYDGFESFQYLISCLL